MKKGFMFLIAAAFTLLFLVGASAAALGDVDGSGAVESADARLALRAAVGLEPAIAPGTEAFAAADADFSGEITADDARSILRDAVGLEFLSDRLPESAALTEEELKEKINACVLDFFVDYEAGSGNTGVGFAIDANGTVVVPYSLIHKATAITVEREGCKVESVLWAAPENDLALLKVSGDVPFLPVNRSWYNEGDAVYSVDYMHALHRLTLIPQPTFPDVDVTWNLLFAAVPEGEYLFDLGFYPMVDRFGRAIGLILEDDVINDCRTAVASPLSALPAPEAYSPRTVKAFSRDEWRVTLESPMESVEMAQYGTGLIPLYAKNRTIEPVTASTSRTDLIDVSVSFGEAEFPILVIRAKAVCENVPVKVHLDGMYEDAEVTLSVSVTEDGYVNLVGMPILPDPGLVWETLPTEYRVWDAGMDLEKPVPAFNVSFAFMKFNTGLTDEELFYSYTDYLREMGFEYVRMEEMDRMNRYYFRLEEYNFTVEYTDMSASVSITGYFGK